MSHNIVFKKLVSRIYYKYCMLLRLSAGFKFQSPKRGNIASVPIMQLSHIKIIPQSLLFTLHTVIFLQVRKIILILVVKIACDVTLINKLPC